MVDKKLLKEIDAVLAKAAHCLVEENEEIQEQDGNGPPARTGTTTGRKMPKKAEGRLEAEDDELLPGHLRERDNMPKWLYDLLLNNRLIRPKRPEESND